MSTETAESGSGSEGRVLLVRITNLVYPVTLDTLAELFGRVGTVEKAVLFSRQQDACHALVQLSTAETAQAAMKEFHGKNLFDDANFLRIQFSTLEEISVKFNNSRARDFLNFRPTAPGSVVIVYHVDPEISCVGLFNLFSIYGFVQRVKFLHSRADAALVQFSDPVFASLALEFLQGAPLRGRRLQLEIANMSEIVPSTGTNFRVFAAKERRPGSEAPGRVLRGACRPTAVLHVANAASEAALRQALPEARNFRFLKEISDHQALAEFDSVETATNVLVARHNVVVEDRAMKLSFSKSNVGT
jgi:polypyrimidine tract-binding protein 2